MKLIISGNPIYQKRPRFSFQTRRVYDPQEKEKRKVRKQIQDQISDWFKTREISIEASRIDFEDLLGVEVTFHLPIPRSFTKTRLNRISWGLEGMGNKPDVDNLVKFILDCCNGLLFQDDKQIVYLKAQKVYSKNPRTEMKIMSKRELKNHEKAQEILQIFNKEEFLEMIKILKESVTHFPEILSDLCYLDCCNNEENLIKCAVFLSLFSDKFSQKISLVKKHYGSFWKDFEEIEKLKKELKNYEKKCPC